MTGFILSAFHFPCFCGASVAYQRFHVHVHVHLPSRQDAQPPVPWRHPVEGADREQQISRSHPALPHHQISSNHGQYRYTRATPPALNPAPPLYTSLYTSFYRPGPPSKHGKQASPQAGDALVVVRAQHDSSSRGHRQHTPRSTTANTLHLRLKGRLRSALGQHRTEYSLVRVAIRRETELPPQVQIGIQSHHRHARSAHQIRFGSSQSMPHLGHVFRGQSPNPL